MKILIINAGALPVPAVKGGAVENLIELALNDKEIVNENEITVVSVNNEIAKEKSKEYNCKFIYIEETILFKMFRIIRTIFNRLNIYYIGNEYIYRVYNHIKKENKYYDKIIIENAPRFVLLLKHKFSKKIVLHLHNDYLSPSEKFGKQILNEFDEIYCNSKFIVNEVNRIEKTTKTKLLYNGIDLNKFQKKETHDDFYKKYNINKNDKLFIYSGRVVSEKGILELIEAFTELKLEKFKLLIIGSTTNINKKFKKKIMKLTNGNIIFSGYIPYNEINILYSMGYFGIVPSKCNEAFGLSALEMLAMGLPVIYSNDGALSEIVNEKCGFIVNKNNLVQELKQKILLASKITISEYKEMSKNAIMSSKKFSSDEYIKNFKKMIS